MLFDLNELPTEAEEEAASAVPQEPPAVVPQEAAVVVSQPQKSLPALTSHAPNLFQPGEGSQSQGILNNNAFKHASIGSGFQPFVRNKDSSNNTRESLKLDDDMNCSIASSSIVANPISDNAAPKVETCNQVSQEVEREEGEWSDADGISENAGSSVSNKDELVGTASTHEKKESQDSEPHLIKSGDVSKDDTAAECSDAEMADASIDQVLRGPTASENTQNLECKGNQPGDDLDACNRSKDVKGVEANYALKFASNPAKRPKLNEHKEAMLGKKRARQTVFINVEDAKQAGTMKTSTPRRQSSFPAPIVTRTVKEAYRGAGDKAAEKQNQQAIRDQRQSEIMGSERSNSADPSDQLAESNGDAEMEEAELECVPGSFESAEEYIRVFEPLLFEECRAQLYSSYEESLEAVGRDAHVAVRVKTVDRRERGWYDVVVLPMHEYKWNFKEGDVAILSFPRPGSAAQSGRSSRRAVGSNEDAESECGRLVALLKKLAPESYKQVSGSTSTSSEAVAAGSIDELLQSMDQNLFRTLPKLCPKPRMLVCAPSNAATDELLARVLDRGFIDGEMKVYRPDVARVGVDSQSRAAQAVSVERRTDQLLMKGRDEVIGWLHQLKGREQQLSQEIAYLQRDLNMVAAAGRSQGSVGVDPDVLAQRDRNRDILLQKLAASVESRDKVLVEMSRLLILESRFRVGSNFNMEDARASLEASFANEAEIVFTTVSSSGRKLFSRLTHGFDMVVIDEAAQASEVGVLPPLALGAARCVLVGDPQQLPATVISKAAGTLLYSRSLFERFQQAGCPTILLSVQYRMHPQIREFPSKYFYQGRLTDSESVIKLPDEAYYRDALMAPYIFYDMSHGRESHRGGSSSYQNIHEAQFALRLYDHLQKFLKANGGKKVVGNANALMQSEDWAALIADAKARKCFMDLDSIPKDFLPMKVPSNTPGRSSSNNIRNMRTGGPRPRHLDMFPEPRAGMGIRPDEDDRPNSVPRNGSYRNLDDFGRPVDRPRDSMQFGVPRRPNSSNGRREV
nr:unnamed protein product [Digitaria exilis]